MNENDKKLLRNAILVFGIVVVLFIGIIVANKIMTMNAVKEQKKMDEYQSWLSENCECLEFSRPKCTLKDFEYNSERNLCVNEAREAVTYASLACSKYNCSGEIKNWNNETERWEGEL